MINKMAGSKKLLYVDDETLALKYFERLVGEIVPVLTADSVEAGIKVLQEHGEQISILVTDQRMPGAYGNELLQYAREHHPHIVRMLTTAYSEIDDAISAINSGEIYRYITKPWNADSLRADLKNAMELADLKAERDTLLRAKLSVQQGQWLATRVGMLSSVLGCVTFSAAAEKGLHLYLNAVRAQGGAKLDIAWGQTDLADWMQAEALRHSVIASHVRHWCDEWSRQASAPNTQQAQGVLDSDIVQQCFKPLNALLEEPATVVPSLNECAALAWFIWSGCAVHLVEGEIKLGVSPTTDAINHSVTSPVVLTSDWLAADIEQLM